MKKDPTLKKFQNKLIWEAALRSLFAAFVVACTVASLVGVIFWLTPVSGTWFTVGTAIVLFAALTPVFYFCNYRPNDIDVARRLDSLGLEERMITQNQYANDDSYIAVKQSEDAKAALANMGATKIPFALSWLAVIPLAISACLGGGMITVNALTDAEIIRGGNEIIDVIVDPEPEVWYNIRYVVVGLDIRSGMIFGVYEDEGGFIEGDDEQLVLKDGYALPVSAEAEDGWAFLCWDFDENQADPYRGEDMGVIVDGLTTEDEDGNITITHTAYFAMLGEGDGEPGDQPGNEEVDPDSPMDPDQQIPSQGGDKDVNPDAGAGDEGGGKYEDKNQMIDGSQYYRDLYEQYRAEAEELLKNGEEIPEYLKEFIKKYYDTVY